MGIRDISFALCHNMTQTPFSTNLNNFAKIHEICVSADAKGKNESLDAVLSSCRCFSKSAAVRCNQFNLRHVNNRQNYIFLWTALWSFGGGFGEDFCNLASRWKSLPLWPLASDDYEHSGRRHSLYHWQKYLNVKILDFAEFPAKFLNLKTILW